MPSVPDGCKVSTTSHARNPQLKSPDQSSKPQKRVPILIGEDAKVKRALRSLASSGGAGSRKLFGKTQDTGRKLTGIFRTGSEPDGAPNLSSYLRLANKGGKVKSALGNIVQPGKEFVSDIMQKVNKYVKFGEGGNDMLSSDTASSGCSSENNEFPNRVEQIRRANDKTKYKIQQSMRFPETDTKREDGIPFPSKLDAYCSSDELTKYIRGIRNTEKMPATNYQRKLESTPRQKYKQTNQVSDPKTSLSKYVREHLDNKMPSKIVSITKVQPRPKTVKNKVSRPVSIQKPATARSLQTKSGIPVHKTSLGKLDRNLAKAKLRPSSAIVMTSVTKSPDQSTEKQTPKHNAVNKVSPLARNTTKIAPNNSIHNIPPVKTCSLPRTSNKRVLPAKTKRPKTTSHPSMKIAASPRKSDKTSAKLRKRAKGDGSKSARNHDSFTRPVHCKDMKKSTLDSHARQLQEIVLNADEEKKQCSFKERIEKLRQTNEQTKRDIKRLLQLNTEERKLVTYHSTHSRSATVMGK